MQSPSGAAKPTGVIDEQAFGRLGSEERVADPADLTTLACRPQPFFLGI
jgi:hypothetical protein